MTAKGMLGNATPPAPVVIALSTYNGERYLEALLNSLLSQDYPNFRIVVRDDGSSDGTLAIIDSFCSQHPWKVVHSRRFVGNVGVTRSFLCLLDHVEDGAYLMFCDQDDVWFEDKISRFMVRMREVESDGVVPALVFGDMVVTDQDLNVVAPSFWAYQRLDPNTADDWRRLMMSNVVTGCSSMCNSAAVVCLRSAPSLTVLHDHLAAIVVARYGVVAKLAQPTMFYRQHLANVEGARAFGMRYLVTRAFYFLKVIVPRYRAMCKAFGVPISLAVYLKFESVFRRLARNR
ncbi:MAG: glycosyltransferase family 2 protein [Betaproteobacteria bacterium]|jgi:glycosyltransferase involved in cell wall biosynthesis